MRILNYILGGKLSLRELKSKIWLYLRQFLLLDIWRGLAITNKYLWRKKVTILYPEEKTPKSTRFRGLHALRRDQIGEELCIACKLCEAVCPAAAIVVVPEECNGNKRAKEYEIDLFKCIYCGLCQEVCPVDAVVETRVSDYLFTKRGQHILTKEKLLAIGDQYKHIIDASLLLEEQ